MRQEGIEPSTYGLRVRCSTWLSYWRIRGVLKSFFATMSSFCWSSKTTGRDYRTQNNNSYRNYIFYRRHSGRFPFSRWFAMHWQQNPLNLQSLLVQEHCSLFFSMFGQSLIINSLKILIFLIYQNYTNRSIASRTAPSSAGRSTGLLACSQFTPSILFSW